MNHKHIMHNDEGFLNSKQVFNSPLTSDRGAIAIIQLTKSKMSGKGIGQLD